MEGGEEGGREVGEGGEGGGRAGPDGGGGRGGRGTMGAEQLTTGQTIDHGSNN
jgi:hypothetical protein